MQPSRPSLASIAVRRAVTLPEVLAVVVVVGVLSGAVLWKVGKSKEVAEDGVLRISAQQLQKDLQLQITRIDGVRDRSVGQASLRTAWTDIPTGLTPLSDRVRLVAGHDSGPEYLALLAGTTTRAGRPWCVISSVSTPRCSVPTQSSTAPTWEPVLYQPSFGEAARANLPNWAQQSARMPAPSNNSTPQITENSPLLARVSLPVTALDAPRTQLSSIDVSPLSPSSGSALPVLQPTSSAAPLEHWEVTDASGATVRGLQAVAHDSLGHRYVEVRALPQSSVASRASSPATTSNTETRQNASQSPAATSPPSQIPEGSRLTLTLANSAGAVLQQSQDLNPAADVFALQLITPDQVSVGQTTRLELAGPLPSGASVRWTVRDATGLRPCASSEAAPSICTVVFASTGWATIESRVTHPSYAAIELDRDLLVTTALGGNSGGTDSTTTGTNAAPRAVLSILPDSVIVGSGTRTFSSVGSSDDNTSTTNLLRVWTLPDGSTQYGNIITWNVTPSSDTLQSVSLRIIDEQWQVGLAAATMLRQDLRVTLSLVAGNEQRVRQGQMTPSPLILEARGAYGQLLPNLRIEAVGRGSAQLGTATTDANGRLSWGWQAPDESGRITMNLRALDRSLADAPSVPATLIVMDALQGISRLDASVTLDNIPIGQSAQIAVTLTQPTEQGTPLAEAATFRSLQPTLASVDATGRVMALDLGSASIVVTATSPAAPGFVRTTATDTVIVRVVRGIPIITSFGFLRNDILPLAVGDTLPLQSTSQPLTRLDQPVAAPNYPLPAPPRPTFRSLDTLILRVSGDTSLIGVRAGNTKLVATASVAMPATGYLTNMILDTIDVIVNRSGSVTQLVVRSGGMQSARRGSFLPDSILIQARDARGRPVPDVPIGRVVTGAGRTTAAATTDPSGHLVIRWQLDTIFGPQRLTLNTLGEDAARLDVTATAVSGPVSTLALVATGMPATTLMLGDTLNGTVRGLTVELRDANGYAARRAGLWIQAALLPPGVGGTPSFTTIRADTALRRFLTPAVRTDSTGRAVLLPIVFGGATGTWRILGFIATDSAGTPLQAVGVPLGSRVATAGGAFIATQLGPNFQQQRAGLPVQTLPEVRVTDAWNNPVAGRAVTFRVGPSAAIRTVTTNALGLARLPAWSAPSGSATRDTVTAEVAGISQSPFVWEVRIANVMISVQSPAVFEGPRGLPLDTVSLRAVDDATWSPWRGLRLRVTPADDSSGRTVFILPARDTMQTTDSLGVLRFIWTLGLRVGSQSLHVHDVVAGERRIFQLDATARATRATRILLDTLPRRLAMGVSDTSQRIRARLVDAVGLPVAEAGRLARLTVLDTLASVQPTAAPMYTNAQGEVVWIGPIFTGRFGIHPLRVSIAGVPDTIVSVSVLHGRPATLAISRHVTGQTVSPGQPFSASPIVRLLDAYGNGIPGDTVFFTVTEGQNSGAYLQFPRVVTSDSTATQQRGSASPGQWRTGTLTGPQVIEAVVRANTVLGYPEIRTIISSEAREVYLSLAPGTMIPDTIARGDTLSGDMGVLAMDLNWTPLINLDLAVSVTQGSGTVFRGIAPVTQIRTGSAGLATFRWKTGYTVHKIYANLPSTDLHTPGER